MPIDATFESGGCAAVRQHLDCGLHGWRFRAPTRRQVGAKAASRAAGSYQIEEALTISLRSTDRDWPSTLGSRGGRGSAHCVSTRSVKCGCGPSKYTVPRPTIHER